MKNIFGIEEPNEGEIVDSLFNHKNIKIERIISSDKIVIIDGGRVAEEGSPDILLKNKDSHFSKLYNLTD